MRLPGDVVVVGASVAGLTVVEGLRAEGHDGRIVLIGDEVHAPYGRPPLSKQVLAGDWELPDATWRGADELAALDVELRLGHPATGLDLATREVAVGERRVSFDTLVVATGVVPRRLPVPTGLAGVHVLRTIDDALALRAELGADRTVAVIGSGVLGMEVASAARAVGARVTLLGRTASLSFGSVSTLVSPMLMSLLVDNGVDVRTRAEVVGLTGDTRVTGLDLAGAEHVDADLVVVAIGSLPATSWLAGSGLDISDGVLCDPHGVAAPGIYAVGDVARWGRGSRVDSARRAEHQSNAIEQALAVAHLIVTGETSPAILPFFWSDLFGTKIQAFGRFPTGVRFAVSDGSPDAGRFVAEASAGDVVVGVVGWNAPREFRLARARVDRSA